MTTKLKAALVALLSTLALAALPVADAYANLHW
jgi:hypothetical protein